MPQKRRGEDPCYTYLSPKTTCHLNQFSAQCGDLEDNAPRVLIRRGALGMNCELGHFLTRLCVGRGIAVLGRQGFELSKLFTLLGAVPTKLNNLFLLTVMSTGTSKPRVSHH